MAADHMEIEVKLDVDDGTPAPRLDSLPAVASVTAPVQHELRATYYDTDELALASAGITIRRRTGGEDAGWHLKLPGDGYRHEVRVPLRRATNVVPKELRSLVRALVREARLRPVVDLRTRREVFRLLDADGRALAEICDDRVEADVASVGSHPASASTWREWEVELVEGDGALLEEAVAQLRAAGGVPSRAPSKLVRALGDRLPERDGGPRPTLRKKAPASDVVRARIAEQVAEVRRLDPLVRRDVPDAVHQMRVALRRLRSALATFRPLLNREVTEPIRGELRWLGQALGDVRDTEVLHERLREMLSREAAVVVRGPVRARIDRHMRDRYLRARAGSLEAMESARYFALLDRLDELVTATPFSDASREQAGDVLPRRVRRDWKRVKSRADAVRQTDDPAERAARLHDVRKAAKRARYAAEPLCGLYGKDARRFVKAMKRVQTVLGDHHDSTVLQSVLREQADAAAADGDNAFTYGVLHARSQADAAAVEARFVKAWRSASRKGLRRWLS